MAYTGALLPVLTASAQNGTSATISWTLQMFSLPVIRYMYSLSRTSSLTCADVRPSETTNDLSVTFTDLQEFSVYSLSLTTVFDSFGSEVVTVAALDISTVPVQTGKLLTNTLS